MKKSGLSFLCPLCHSMRSFRYSAQLKGKNYAQITLTCLCLTIMLFPWLRYQAIFPGFFLFFFAHWAVWILIQRLLFRREVPCPHCGFNAIHYKKDIALARKSVSRFWEEKKSLNSSASASAPAPAPSPAPVGDGGDRGDRSSESGNAVSRPANATAPPLHTDHLS